MAEYLDVRLVTMVSGAHLDAIENYQFGNRMSSRGEATRDIIEAGLVQLGLIEAKPAAEDLPAPKIPDVDATTISLDGHALVPFLRKTGKREYTLEEVLEGAFPDEKVRSALGRDKAVALFFKAIGWRAVTTRKGGSTRRLFVAPEEA